jgi:PAS domain S-box-containing protein
VEQEWRNGWTGRSHPDELDFCVKSFQQAVEQHHAFELENRLRHQSGEYRWIVDIGKPICGVDDNFSGYIGYCLDIHDRKETEGRLLGLPGSHQLILESMKEGVFILDSDGTTKFANPAACDMLGWPLEELLGSTAHSDDCCPLRLPLEDGEPRTVNQDVFWGKDEMPVEVELTATGMRGDLDLLIRTAVTFKAIERNDESNKLAESKLQEQNSLFNSVPGLVLFQNTRNRLVKENPAAPDSLGYNAQDVEGKKIEETLPLEAAEYFQEDGEIIQAKTLKREILECINKDGQESWMLTETIPHFEKDGQVEGIVVFSMGITKH